MDLDLCVGTNIRKYRKANHLTLNDLASRINKSVSTVSKYEKGQISVDVTTLSEISSTLHVMPVQLLAEPVDNSPFHPSSGYHDLRYLYTYNRDDNCIVRSVMERFFTPEDKEHFHVVFFNDVENLKAPENCNGLYTGIGYKSSMIENYYLQNEDSTSEHVMINCISNLVKHKQHWAMVAGLSNNLMLPIAFKAIMTERPVANEAELIEKLKFSKEEIQQIKKDHYLLVQNR